MSMDEEGVEVGPRRIYGRQEEADALPTPLGTDLDPHDPLNMSDFQLLKQVRAWARMPARGERL
jgi:hypothetical protein